MSIVAISAVLAGCSAASSEAEGPGGPETISEPPVPHGRPLLLQPVRVSGDRVLFADETSEVSDALAAVLSDARFGFRVVPPPELRSLWSDARAGRLPNVAGTCEAPPPPAALAAHLHPGASTAAVTIACGGEKAPPGECLLEVVIREPDAEPGGRRPREIGRFGMSLPRAETPRAWAARIRQGPLSPRPAPPPPEGMGVLGVLHGGPKPGLYLKLREAYHDGPWSRPIQERQLQSKLDAFAACEVKPRPRWRDHWAQAHVIEVAPDGRVTRCEPEYPDRLPPPEFQCQCGVLASIDFGAAPAPRRALLDLWFTRVGAGKQLSPLHRGAYLVDKRADDASAVLGSDEIDQGALLDCLDSVAEPFGEIAVPVRFEVGPTGKVVQHTAVFSDRVPSQAAACLDGLLADAWFTCPLTGRASVTATLELVAKPFGETSPTP